MLRSLRIQNLGVIDDAEVEFAPGLNVITGETGAGKTMVVTGLGLLLGARADATLVRTGTGSAVVEGDVGIEPDHPAAQRVSEAGGSVEDGVILVRTVSAAGRSKAHVGGRAAPVGVLVEVGEALVAVHGQSDQWRLRDGDEHRVILDTYGGAGVVDVLNRYTKAFHDWQRVRRELADVTASSAERAREAQMLRAALDEIAAVDPQRGEEDDLLAEEIRLAHADALRHGAAAAHELLIGNDDPQAPAPAIDLIGQAAATVVAVSEHDEQLRELGSRVSELVYAATDVARDLGAYAESIDSDPARLAHVQQRRAAVGALLRNYGATSGQVLEWAAESATRLAQVDISDDQIAQLRTDVEAARCAVAELGETLTAARSEAADRLGASITAEVQRLAMGSAMVTVELMPRVSQTGEGTSAVSVADGWRHARASGLEDVEIRLAANPGSIPRPITKAASGGELSRVMLALEIVCAQSQVPTYVFDEVDAGVGGAAALELGARLAQLAQHSQVLVVTHLGQVAAFADRHLMVDKNSDGHVTSSAVKAVSGEERVAEIARMIGGDSDSAAALTHARELLSRHTPRVLGSP